MRWEDFRSSDNVEDRRGEADSGGGGGGGGGGLGPIIRGGGGLGIGAIIVIFIIAKFTGIDFGTLLGGAEQVTGGQRTQQSAPANPAPDRPRAGADDRLRQFVGKVLAETEDTWSKVLPEQKGVQYEKPKLVLYDGVTRSGCGRAEAAMGPFYCPVDHKVYLDMAFFGDMKRRLGGGGDFAYAYVISHEIGHHIQNLLGILPKTQRMQQAAQTRAEANGISVRIELQADCLAGVWAANANQNFHILEAGDVDKALSTAAAIGDDRLQRASRGTAVPDSFTHGSSEQRQRWLNKGLQSGKIDACDTFAR